MFQCVCVCTVFKGQCTWAQPHEVSRSCGLAVFSAIVRIVGAAGDGHWRWSRCQGELWCAFIAAHTTSLFLHLCSYVTFSFFLEKKKEVWYSKNISRSKRLTPPSQTWLQVTVFVDEGAMRGQMLSRVDLHRL